MDATPESLKALEAWYFESLDSGFMRTGVRKIDVDHAIGAYFGRVCVQSAGFEWFVEEYAFVPGRYDIGVRKGLMSLMLTLGLAPAPLERNRRKQSLFRQFRKYAA